MEIRFWLRMATNPYEAFASGSVVEAVERVILSRILSEQGTSRRRFWADRYPLYAALRCFAKRLSVLGR